MIVLWSPISLGTCMILTVVIISIVVLYALIIPGLIRNLDKCIDYSHHFQIVSDTYIINMCAYKIWKLGFIWQGLFYTCNLGLVICMWNWVDLCKMCVICFELRRVYGNWVMSNMPLHLWCDVLIVVFNVTYYLETLRF